MSLLKDPSFFDFPLKPLVGYKYTTTVSSDKQSMDGGNTRQRVTGKDFSQIYSLAYLINGNPLKEEVLTFLETHKYFYIRFASGAGRYQDAIIDPPSLGYETTHYANLIESPQVTSAGHEVWQLEMVIRCDTLSAADRAIPI